MGEHLDDKLMSLFKYFNLNLVLIVTDVSEALFFSIDPFTGDVFLTADVGDDEIKQSVSLSVHVSKVKCSEVYFMHVVSYNI